MNADNHSLKYIYPVLLIAVITAIKYFFLFHVAVTVPFILYFVGVFLSAYLWGLKPAVLAIICSTLAAVYFFMEPYHDFALDTHDIERVFLFLLECGIILFLAATIHRAKGLVAFEQKRFRLLIEKSNVGLALFDEKGKLFYISPSVYNVLGYTPEEYKKKDVTTLVFPDEMQKIVEITTDVMQHPGKSVTLEHRYRHADGRWIIVETTLSNFLEEEGVNAIVSNFRDVTDKINLEQQREDFIGIVSHELKTPLTTIKGYYQLAEQNPEMLADAHRKTGQQIQKMERLIQDLLDTTAILKSKLQLNIHSTDMNILIQDAVQNARLGHSKQNIELNLGKLPNVLCDEYRISQVITNMLNNAVKYSPEDSKITIESLATPNAVVVKISDEGVGLTETQKESVFKRFYRGAFNISGLGLGLYISAQIIQMHNGTIEVESEEGKGSTFSFSLPLTDH
jgi:PAS domain S-box-containing protein